MNKLAAFALSIIYARAEESEYCRALVMSGGGSNGAWEAGVIWGLMHYSNTQDFKYDIVSGISVGSVNAVAMALFPKGQEIEMSEWLSDMWVELKTEDVWKPWYFGISWGLFWESSVVDNSPLLQTL